MEHTEEDERRDSSPGFDVLVDDRDCNKNDQEHLLVGERYANGPYVEYDGGGSVDYVLDYLNSECNEREFCGFDSACYPVDSFSLDHFREHDTVATLGYIPHNRINLEKSSFEEYGRRFIDPRNFISSVEDASFDQQYTEIGDNLKRRPENRKGAKGGNSHIKRRRDFEPGIGSEEIESRSTHRRQHSLMGECSQPSVSSSFRKQNKRNRRKQRHHYTKPAEGAANVKRDFTGPKTLAQIKEEKCRSKLSSQPNDYMPHGRSFSNDFEGPKPLSELLKAKSMSYGGKGIIL